MIINSKTSQGIETVRGFSFFDKGFGDSGEKISHQKEKEGGGFMIKKEWFSLKKIKWQKLKLDLELSILLIAQIGRARV